MKINSAVFLFLACFASFSQASSPRIISAGSTVTELLFALGAQEHVVAVDLSSRQYLFQERLQVPLQEKLQEKLKEKRQDKDTQQKREIPVLGYHRQLGAEGLLALNPTHLIGSPEMGPESTLNLLKASKVKVISLTSGESLEDFHQRIDILAGITNTQEKAEIIKKDMEAKMGALKNNAPAKKPKVMFMMLSKGRPISVAGNNTTINTVITLAGGINPAAKQTNNYKPFSSEAIVEMQPDYILISSRSMEALNGLKGILKQQPLLASTPAFQKGNVIPISGSSILGGFGLASLELANTLNAQFTLLDSGNIK